jgi:hypothetical protein
MCCARSGAHFGGRHLAIVGGAVPGLFVPVPPAGLTPHVGTADLDFHLSLHLLDGETADYYRAIIGGLRSLGLRPDVQDGREIKWRWLGHYRETRLQVELLCPVRTRAGRPEEPASDTPAEANIGPSGEIAALAVGFGYLVPLDTTFIERRVRSSRGTLTYEFPVAGLTSWLCLKSDAIMRRDKPKDAYDVVWLIDALGPETAAELVATSSILAGKFARQVVRQIGRLTHDQFLHTGAVGPVSYAAFLDVDPGEVERQHAHGSIAAFGNALLGRGIKLSD